MGQGSGVSLEAQPGGKWRIRWRETVEQGGKRKKVQRSKTVEDQATARELAVKVQRALDLGEAPDLEVVRHVPVVVTLDAVLDGWLDSRDARGITDGSYVTFGSFIRQILARFREILELPDTEQVPGTVLTRDGVIKLTNELRAGDYAEGTVYAMVRMLVQAWTWASDDPAEYPGLVPAPRDPAAILPRPPIYAAAPSPTMAECDAMLRQLRRLRRAPEHALHAGVIARCTGLRVAQIYSIRVGDVDLERGVLAVTSGKSRREKAGRDMPMAPVLVEHLRSVLEGKTDRDELLLLGGHELPSMRSIGPARTMTRAWEKATEAKEVREAVWKPPAHKKARPDHAFRAAFQGHLVSAGVRDEVIDLLVGYAGGVRERHYVDPAARWQAMVEAVAQIPPITWRVLSVRAGRGSSR